ncbi:hypothetical protein D4764_06G0005190 [Takifugu flavidus]|uniref:Peptidase A2 domain-containing protein n=1 Tax=Takifugu flavidus TaxID=433684 RepID=A0A5C6MW26_9TELE|nr:hypothetical protein D4764_06G0005190 [Takifugu flavidus]
MDSPFSISPPENFDFSDFPRWPNWIRRFERFRVAAGLDQKVYKLAEHCNYGAMQEEMIRDRLVVGIRYQGLSESLQMDSELTLAKAVLKIRQHEEIKKQQPTVRDTGGPDHNEANVDMMKYKKSFKSTRKVPKARVQGTMKKSKEAVDVEEEVETVFLGSVSAGGRSKTWQKTLILNGQQTTFKLDTGADVTAIPAKVYSKKQQHGPLTTATKRLLGPGDNALQVKAIEALQLAYTVDSIKEQIDIKRLYPKVFTGLGCLRGMYKIKLSKDAKPYALSLPTACTHSLIRQGQRGAPENGDSWE